jgi:hypothetical protein
MHRNSTHENFALNTSMKQNTIGTNLIIYLVRNKIYNTIHSNTVNALLICVPF